MNLLKIVFKICIIFFIVVFVLPNSSHIYKNISISFTRLPKEYNDYSFVVKLDSLFLNSNLKLKVFKSIYQENLTKLNDSINYLRINKLDSTTVTWYKINNFGKIVDSISSYNEYMHNVDSYLVNTQKNYFLSWLRDGDTLKKPVTLLNKGEILREDEANEYFKDIQFGTHEYIYQSNSDEPIVKVIFYKNNMFYQCFTTEKTRVPYKDFPNYKDYAKLTNFGKFLYYHKTDWNGHWFPNIGLYLNGRRPEHWDGYAYLDLNIMNETFKVKDYCSLNEGDIISNAHQGFSMYENPNKKYYFLLNESNHSVNTYYLLSK